MSKSKTMTVAKIAKIVAEDIQLLVNQARESAIHAMPDYKSRYEDLVVELKRIHNDSVSMYQAFKKEGLTCNTIEAEGGVRVSKLMMTAIKEVENQSE